MTSDPAEVVLEDVPLRLSPTRASSASSAKERASVDGMLVLALVKLVEIVGEAASRVSKEYQA
ncbi:MAG: hypothetical protein QNJ65_01815 [Xenococcaceae cyanobacterium MO_234.B1]|nr:hypothetical protein [Xenococcaceae cyanobacterium MO_234.B1]